MLLLKDYRDKAKSYGDLLGWFGLVSDGVIATLDGRLLASFYFMGDDHASSTVQDTAALSARVNAILCHMLDARWSVHVDTVRRYTAKYSDEGAFPDRTTALIDAERRAQYEAEGSHLESVQAITLCWEVPTLAGAKSENWLFGDGQVAENKDSHHSRQMAKFLIACDDFQAACSDVLKLRRMRSYCRGTDHIGREEVFDEQLSYYDFCATGLSREVRLPAIPAHLDRVIGRVGMRVEHLIAKTGFSPGNVVMLGNGNLVKALTINGFPDTSKPAILAALDQLGFEYRWNTRFLVMDQARAEWVLGRERSKWIQKQRPLMDQIRGTNSGAVDKDAVLMVHQVEEALSDLSSGSVKYGHYTSSIIIMDTDPISLAEKTKEVGNIVRRLGFAIEEETINNADAFIGSMPGNRIANVRGAPINTLNLADLLPLTTTWAGFAVHPCPKYPKNSPPLLYARTSGSTPFRLCTHVDDVGHHLVLGPTGSGKTTILNVMVAQHFRYPNARVFGFDRKLGNYVTCKAAGGDYYDIGGQYSDQQFCPLSCLETDDDLAWAAEWLETCIVLQGVAPSVSLRTELFNAVKKLAKGTSRSLTDLVSTVQNVELREALNHYTLSGAMGYMLDAQTDTLQDSDYMMFEMENLAGLGDKNLLPVMLYLFRRMEKRLDGRSPTYIPIDESFFAISHPFIAAKIQDWLKTLRSKNAFVGLFSQEPQDVIKSKLKDVVLASCPTKILLANPDARGGQRPMYEELQCNDTEIEIISSMRRKLHYYYKSPEGRRIFNLGLGPVALAFAGASGIDAAKEAHALMEIHGPTGWVPAWLQLKGVEPRWVEAWGRLQPGGRR
jgi:type IV secretion system protein VirB4